jgi:hypothetical protein
MNRSERAYRHLPNVDLRANPQSVERDGKPLPNGGRPRKGCLYGWMNVAVLPPE